MPTSIDSGSRVKRQYIWMARETSGSFFPSEVFFSERGIVLLLFLGVSLTGPSLSRTVFTKLKVLLDVQLSVQPFLYVNTKKWKISCNFYVFTRKDSFRWMTINWTERFIYFWPSDKCKYTKMLSFFFSLMCLHIEITDKWTGTETDQKFEMTV